MPWIPSPEKLKYPSDPLEKNSGSVKVVLAIVNHITFFFDRNSLHRQSAGKITCLMFTLWPGLIIVHGI